MTSSLDFGRKILMKRMIQTLEHEGYRVEFAEDYNGWIVAGQGEDPAVMLLEADTIEKFRTGAPGSASGFLEGIISHVQSQISAQGSQSLQPPPGEAVAEYADVPSAPPTAVTGEVADDMIVAVEEEEAEEAEEELSPEEADEPAEEEPADDEIAQEEELPVDEDQPEAGEEELSVNMDDLDDMTEDEAPAEPDGESDEQEKIESESTEEISLEDFKE